ncbi:Oligoribonuclease NrnB or cAMP/cGMP phosphodiesterase, DHH superfamily [Oceanobacillus limi]|uniref:Oligoribonuclease NrnB or cAMP/cGMP phosphodiesterase, DHH superfamily n=1 Tax=Oceanobacillus limi TaxID=930131 RepID=A0A1I0GB86_9BACI|nr:oligoribonuclease [Oceanobacillus limi]SET67418.1 Oligoribonuclease NrnB or cAMP/cGMP phosphodiesterase, DHH superfamily [Oceanobacillus limi]
MFKLLSHNDLDGVSCGILAKLAFGKDVRVRYNSISGLDREVEWFLENGDKNTFLFITDLSVNTENEKRLDEFFKLSGNVQLIDHHKTALHLNQYDWGHVIVENETGKLNSATSLLYEYLVKHNYLQATKAIDEFVELVRQYDTWEWEKNDNQDAQRLNALFFLISIDEFEEKMIERLSTSDTFYFDKFEQKILDMEETKTDRYIRKKRRELVQTKIDDYYAGVVFAESYHSELGNELGKDNPHLDYIVIINIGAKRAGFRTIHDHIDVSEIAGKFGGGGHAKASGCSLTDDAYQLFVAETFPLEPLREDARRNRYNVKESDYGTIYQGHQDKLFFLHSTEDGKWKITQNNNAVGESFLTFTDAEKHLKRNYEAWLARDDVFVHYLIEQVKKN